MSVCGKSLILNYHSDEFIMIHNLEKEDQVIEHRIKTVKVMKVIPQVIQPTLQQFPTTNHSIISFFPFIISISF